MKQRLRRIAAMPAPHPQRKARNRGRFGETRRTRPLLVVLLALVAALVLPTATVIGLATYLSSRATTFPGFEPADNCFILEDNTIQPFVTIGENVTLWSGNHIGHHTRIGANCFIASHVVISGGVQVGDNVFIGVNATLRDQVKVGARSVIGAGSLVLEDVPEDGVVAARGTELAKIPSHRLRRL